MSRARRAIILAVASALGLFTAAGVPGGRGARVEAQSALRPNVVVILVDDLDSRAFARMLSLGLLPNIQSAIVGHGVTFTNSFVTNALCAPSRATFLTGQYSHNHGVLSNAPPNGGVTALDDTRTLATWMHAAGYRTGMIGKYLNFYGGIDVNRDGTLDIEDAKYVPPGWDDWEVLLDPSTYLMYQYTINRNGSLVSYGSASGDYQTDVLAARAAKFVDDSEASDAQPFFLTIAPAAPHSELWPAVPDKIYSDAWRWTIRPAPRHAGTITVGLPPIPSFNETDVSDKPAWIQAHPLLTNTDMTFAQRKYQDRLGAMRAVDDLVGSVVQALVRDDELANTVLVFTSDNGFFIGEHRLAEKLTAHEESIRVPLVISVPTMTRAQNSTALVLNNDVAPTIAELGGATPDRALDGRSLVPLLSDPGSSAWRRRFLVEHWPIESRTLGVFEVPLFAAVRMASLTWVEYQDNAGSREFYDATTDPYQLTSLHDSTNADRVSQRQVMSQWLGGFRDCGGGTCQTLEFWVAR